MRDLIVSIFGEYQPIMTTALVEDPAGVLFEVETVASGMAGVDWPYILGVLSYLVVLYSFFRIVGLIFGGRR